MTSRATEMESALRRLGFKLTPQRLAIVRTFADDPTHPTAQEIYDRLRAGFPGMSVATVYNTLATLREAGLCNEITVSGGAVRFDPTTRRHHHTVCDRCGAVRDVEPARAARPEQEIPGFTVRAVEHVYRGLCAACHERAAAS